MKDLLYTYDSLQDFYDAALVPAPEGDKRDLELHLKRDESYFRGMSLDEIQKNKYCYKKGLDSLKELELDINVGGSKHLFTYNEFDGDDLNYDRLLEGFPAMKKRIKTHGIGSGRLINVYVVISENCCVNAEDMLNKAYTAIQIVDMLENMGYRVAVYACDSTLDVNGRWKDKTCVRYEVRICLKRHEDSLNKGLILNGISPWFFRYFIFAHQKGHYKNSPGMGRATLMQLEQTKENIVINCGQCLSKDSADRKIKEIETLFQANQIR